MGAIAFALALLPTCLMLHQNYLLVEQNRKLDLQSHLLESQRRSALIFELTSILEQIEVDRSRRPPAPQKGAAEEFQPQFHLSKSLTGRIVALSKSLRPYLFVDVPVATGRREGVVEELPDEAVYEQSPQLTRRALSPERGQLLLTLLGSDIALVPLFQAGVDFTSADLRKVNAEAADLTKVDLSYADLSGAMLRNSLFVDATLRWTRLDGSNLKGANLHQVFLLHSSLSGCNLEDVRFEEAQLYNVNFEGAVAMGAVWRGADLGDANLDGLIVGVVGGKGAASAPQWVEHTLASTSGLVPGTWIVLEEAVPYHPYLGSDKRAFVVRRKKS